MKLTTAVVTIQQGETIKIKTESIFIRSVFWADSAVMLYYINSYAGNIFNFCSQINIKNPPALIF